MKKFEDILKTTQPELKAYLKRYLISKEYTVVDGDGYLYAKGTVPVLLVAHMDRHPMQDARVKTIKKEIKDSKVIWSSPEGICGDDRCGCYAVMNIINESHCSVLFCEDEEKGSIGAGKFCKTEFIKTLDVNYMIQIDRRGSHDLVFYTNDNRDFVKWLEQNTDFKEAFGSFTDICKLMPASGIAGVNFSTGYYLEHNKAEYIVIEELNHTIETIKKLVKIKVKEPFKYVEKKYEWHNSWGNWNLPYDVRPAKSNLRSMQAKQITLVILMMSLKNWYLR